MAQVGGVTLKVETDFSSDAIQLLKLVLAAQKERIALLEGELTRLREGYGTLLSEQEETIARLQREALGQ